MSSATLSPKNSKNKPPHEQDQCHKAHETKAPSKHFDFNHITDAQFQAAADHMKLEPDIQMLLRTP